MAMSHKNPLIDPKAVPTKEELQEYLGPSRYRRFEVVYDELLDLKFTPKLQWSDLGQSWYHAFYYKKKIIFTIEWGIDYFSACLTLNTEQYTQLVRNENIAADARALVQKSSQSRGVTRIEANLEHSKEQEAFFDLLPLLLQLPH